MYTRVGRAEGTNVRLGLSSAGRNGRGERNRTVRRDLPTLQQEHAPQDTRTRGPGCWGRQGTRTQRAVFTPHTQYPLGVSALGPGWPGGVAHFAAYTPYSFAPRRPCLTPDLLPFSSLGSPCGVHALRIFSWRWLLPFSAHPPSSEGATQDARSRTRSATWMRSLASSVTTLRYLNP